MLSILGRYFAAKLVLLLMHVKYVSVPYSSGYTHVATFRVDMYTAACTAIPIIVNYNHALLIQNLNSSLVDYRQKRIPYLPINLAIVSIVGSSYNVNYTKA